MKAIQRNALLTVSHLAVLAAGYAFHRGAGANSPEMIAVSALPPPVEMPKPGPVRPLSGYLSPGEGPWSAGDLRRAWHALKGSALPPDELAILRDKLRREWLVKDLRAALMVWSDEETLDASDVGTKIQGHLKGHEEEMLDWILAGDFGLDGRAVLDCWAARVGEKDRGLVLRSLGKIPVEFREQVIQSTFRWSMTVEEIDACVEELAKLTDDGVKTACWNAMLRGIAFNAINNGGPDRIHELIARQEIPGQARQAGLGLLAERIARSSQPAKAMEDFHKLSDDDQLVIAPQLLAEAKGNALASGSAVPNVLEMLCELENWELLAEEGPAAIDTFLERRKQSGGELSRWALKLPAREETAEIFRRAVSERFREDLEEGATWVASLPEGWHREQAFAQLAISADRDHRNAAMRDQALAGIADPALQQEMREWRAAKAVAK
ncbi:hypothetical protein [Luteolibacter luteus]|uniref:Uncharacterized protein n=1 Tax=Luteolibacter luteus TaxID=2728835 RepID=A0A858RJZ7_9BACT|nr:hypothetical protein [Luteolibacter luteus]QJE97045.1 hypothetical protein HHL09_15040 [Luteolibacter luteus]